MVAWDYDRTLRGVPVDHGRSPAGAARFLPFALQSSPRFSLTLRTRADLYSLS